MIAEPAYSFLFLLSDTENPVDNIILKIRLLGKITGIDPAEQ